MILHVLRHAEAEDVAPSGRDADRRLTEDGKRRMKAVAKAVAALDPGYDTILVSHLVRARETAEAVAEACGFRGELVETKHLGPNADPEELLHELARRKPRSVLVVGHQPHLGRLLGLLLTGRRDMEIPMKKASLSGLEVGEDPSMGRAELKFHLPPKILELIS